MLLNTPLAAHSLLLMRRSTRYFVGGCTMLLTIVSVVVCIEISVATGWSKAAASTQTVNRARKGDRLPLIAALNGKAVELPLDVNLLRAPVFPRRLPDGCESLASSLTHSPLVDIAARCLS
jgi:hypothetical protein